MVGVKICGVTRPQDAEVAVEAGAWAIGVNFWNRSKRFVSDEVARQLAATVGGAVPLVGVFVDAPRAEIAEKIRSIPLDMVQMHGSEPAAACAGYDVPVIKALRLRDSSTWQEAAQYPSEFILADTYVEGAPGGTGEPLSAELIGAGMRERLILAGGLDPDTVAAAIRRVRPFAVDVASGVEEAPGRKDPEKVKRFIENAHSA